MRRSESRRISCGDCGFAADSSLVAKTTVDYWPTQGRHFVTPGRGNQRVMRWN
jgi:hypothetical protein